MAEGVAVGGRQLAAGVHDDPNSKPAPDPVRAPKGWTWNRKDKAWQPAIRRRGPALAAAPAPPEQPQLSTAVDTPGQDPAPGWQQQDEPGGQEPGDDRVDFGDVPQEVKDDVAGLAGLVGAPLLSFLQSVDPYCGTALAENYESIVDATLPLILRSERIVRYFAEGKSDWLLWGKLALALKPVAQAIAEHHVLRTVEVVRDKDKGTVEIVRRDRGQEPGHGHHLQPQPVDPSLYVA